MRKVRTIVRYVMSRANPLLQAASPVALLLIFVSITLAFTYFVHDRVISEQNLHFFRMSQQVVDAIEIRMRTYQNSLLNVRALFTSSEYVSRQEFKRFVESVEINQRYPGIQGIGFTKRIKDSDLEEHVASVRNGGFPQYNIWPDYKRSEYYSILYIEPFNWRNRRAFGYDMFTEATRQKAMAQARDTGSVVISERVTLVQETDQDAQYGFLMYVPVYAHGMSTQTIEERRQALDGFVYAPFRTKDLFEQITQDIDVHPYLKLQIYSGQTSAPHKVIFDSSPDPEPTSGLWPWLHPGTTPLTTKRNLKIGGTIWTVSIQSRTRFLESYNSHSPLYVLLTGLLISGLIFRLSSASNQYSQGIAKREHELRLLTDSLPALVAYIDHHHRYQFSNKYFHEWLGCSPHSLRGQFILRFPIPSVSTDLDLYVERVLNGESIVFDRILNTKKKEHRTIRFQLLPDQRKNGQILGVVLLGTDISEEKAVADSRTFLAEASRILSSSLNINQTTDELAKLITDRISELCSIELFTPKNNVDRFTSVSSPELGPLLKILPCNSNFNHDATSRPIPLPTPILWRSPSSNLSPDLESFIYAPICFRQEVLGSIRLATPESSFPLSADDLRLIEELADRMASAIENSRLYQQSQTVNQAKDEFLATLSHELRTPLNVILGHAELLKSEEFHSPNAKESIEAIYRNARVQTQIISDLLDVSSIITGKISFEPKRLDFNLVLKSAFEGFQLAAASKKVTLKLTTPHQATMIKGDSTRLQQVIWNLLSNAVKFTKPNGWVHVSAETDSHEVVVRIQDSGQGIDPSFLPHVFDRFRQEDGSVTRSFGGLGLGLSIVKSLVEIHGGSIHAESQGHDRGSTFLVRLPLAPAEKEFINPSITGEPQESANKGLKGLRVLIVDDEPDSRQLLARYLEKNGAETRLASSASEGFTIYKNEQPDIIASDISMPIEDGYSFIKRIRTDERRHGGFTPAIALTAFAREEDKQKSLAAGYQMHVTKPVDAQAFRRAIIQTYDRSVQKSSS